MLIIIIGIIICTIILCIEFFLQTKYSSTLVGIIFFFSLLIGLFFPTKFGESELVRQTELVSLSNSTVSSGNVFVSISGEEIYTYRHRIDTEFGTETSTEYVTSSISHDDGNIIESEDINCKAPVLLEYMTKSKVTIWTFGFGVALTDYVFYVPEGTIQKDVQLK